MRRSPRSSWSLIATTTFDCSVVGHHPNSPIFEPIKDRNPDNCRPAHRVKVQATSADTPTFSSSPLNRLPILLNNRVYPYLIKDKNDFSFMSLWYLSSHTATLMPLLSSFGPCYSELLAEGKSKPSLVTISQCFHCNHSSWCLDCTGSSNGPSVAPAVLEVLVSQLLSMPLPPLRLQIMHVSLGTMLPRHACPEKKLPSQHVSLCSTLWTPCQTL